MKRIILFLLIVIAVASACKKSKIEPASPETLQGTWKELLPPHSSKTSEYFTFRRDSTYEKRNINLVITEQGTYRLNAQSSDFRVLDVTLTGTGIPTIFTVAVASNTHIVMTSGGTMGRTFVRQP
ncbi:hypothetical protein GFS24_21730 [Chitinophaga sp. SYP-B3965]|uniref:hypothetical protein n=1 Tax=Chitinophaga sp. SYP-B3965 TaxID=2663120 RepID=UPI0012998E31|nr:hypothetical protein [Chitinophaga sp. SYP-B3965]MRG47759.1 hypothetical protein [Chitinophaga sp. SYP-B3965]